MAISSKWGRGGGGGGRRIAGISIRCGGSNKRVEGFSGDLISNDGSKKLSQKRFCAAKSFWNEIFTLKESKRVQDQGYSHAMAKLDFSCSCGKVCLE